MPRRARWRAAGVRAERGQPMPDAEVGGQERVVVAGAQRDVGGRPRPHPRQMRAERRAHHAHQCPGAGARHRQRSSGRARRAPPGSGSGGLTPPTGSLKPLAGHLHQPPGERPRRRHGHLLAEQRANGELRRVRVAGDAAAGRGADGTGRAAGRRRDGPAIASGSASRRRMARPARGAPPPRSRPVPSPPAANSSTEPSARLRRYTPSTTSSTPGTARAARNGSSARVSRAGG